MKLSESAKLVAVLQAAYPTKELSEESIRLYAEMLSDLDPREAGNAVKRIIATSRFFPTVAEIREAAAENAISMPDVEQAWGEVTRQIKSVGRYRTPVFSHPAITSTVDAIGWTTFCESQSIGVERGHFMKLFQAHAEAAKAKVQLGALAEPDRQVLLPIGDVVGDLVSAKKLTSGQP